MSGVCSGKLEVEPRNAYRLSRHARYQRRYGAKAFRFGAEAADVTVRLNAAGRRLLRKPYFRVQFTLSLRETATGAVRRFSWTLFVSRSYLAELGVPQR